ncbi:hypothetical protein PMAC_002349, partial [Pneumocystis sp. 'macacae']
MEDKNTREGKWVRRGVGEGLQEVASRGWSEEGGSGVKKMCTVQIRWCAPEVRSGGTSACARNIKSRDECARCIDKAGGGVKNKSTEGVEVEIEIRLRLVLRGVGEGYIRGGEVDGVHEVKVEERCAVEIGWEEGVHQAASRGRWEIGEVGRGRRGGRRGVQGVQCAEIRGGEVGGNGDEEQSKETKKVK